MDFIDKAVEKQQKKLGAEKEKPKAEAEEAEKRDQEIREQVDRFLTKVVFPVISKAKRRFEEQGMKAEVDIETSMSLDTERSFYKGIKLQLSKGLEKRSGVPVVIGPSLSFSASPPYSATIAIMAYGPDNNGIFSERFEIEEMTEKLVIDYLKRFVEEVVK